MEMDELVTYHVDKRFLHVKKVGDLRALITVKSQDMPTIDIIKDTLIVILLDTSLSMRGEKMKSICACVRYLFDNLSPDCYISIITFDSRIRELTRVPIRATQENLAILSSTLNNLTIDGNTNIVDAVFRGYEQIEKFTPVVDSVEMILFTDGQHNTGHGWTDIATSVCEMSKVIKIPLNTFSIGANPDSNKLLSISSATAGGHYEHMELLSDVPRVFGEFIGILKSKLQTNLCIEFSARPGTRIISVEGVDCFNEIITPRKHHKYYFGKIHSGMKKSFMIKLSVRNLNKNEIDQLIAGEQSLIDITLYSRDSSIASQTISISRVNSAAIPTDTDTNEILTETLRINLSNAIKRAAQFADNGDLDSAKMLLQSQLDLFRSIGETSEFAKLSMCRIEKLLTRFKNARDYYTNRNDIYGVMSQYKNQSGGDYLTSCQQRESVGVCKYVNFLE
jgi:uncharacterized protein YegL